MYVSLVGMVRCLGVMFCVSGGGDGGRLCVGGVSFGAAVSLSACL